MDSVGSVDIGMKLVVRRSDANGEVVGRTEIVEKEISLLLESDGGLGHAHSEERSGEFNIWSDVVQIAHLHDGRSNRMFRQRRALRLVRSVELERMWNNRFGFADGILFLDELPHVAMAIDDDVISVLVNVKSDERDDWSFLRGDASKVGFEVVFKLNPILVLAAHH